LKITGVKVVGLSLLYVIAVLSIVSNRWFVAFCRLQDERDVLHTDSICGACVIRQQNLWSVNNKYIIYNITHL